MFDYTMSEHVYTFPVNADTSVRFVVKGAHIKQAVLEVGGFKLGTIYPVGDDNWTSETIIPLNFFGETPFRSTLTEGLNPQVHVTSIGIPTLMMEVIKDGICWDTVGDKFTETVTVSTPAGIKTLTIAYLKNACGFVA